MLIKVIRDFFLNKKPETHSAYNVDEKGHKDLEKLQLEIDLIKKNINNYERQQRLESKKVLLSFITSLVAILGIFFTFWNQQKQMNLIQAQHEDDDFSGKVELLAKSLSEESKLAAIFNLTTYLSSSDRNYK